MIPRELKLNRIYLLAIAITVPLISFLFFQRVLAAPTTTVGLAPFGTTIMVTTATDELNSDGDCSLREAIEAANNDAAIDACPAGSGWDTIEIPAGIYQLNLTGADEDANATGDFDILDSVTIIGDNSSTVTLDGVQSDRIFHVDPAESGVTLDLQQVTVINGSSDLGGALKADNGATLISNSTFSHNEVISKGGAIYIDHGLLQIISSTISHNEILTTALDFESTSSGAGRGGGINSNAASVHLENTLVTENLALYGGGLFAEGGSMTLYSSQVLSNTARKPGLGKRSPSGGGVHMVTGILEIGKNSEINYNHTDQDASNGYGGGVYTEVGTLFYLTDSKVNYNFAVSGGGGLSLGGTNFIKNSVINYNSISLEDEDEAGGGIYLDENKKETFIENSTLAHNAGAYGGAIHLYDEVSVVISNTHIYSNTSFYGGGVYLNGYGGVTIFKSVFEDNVAIEHGGAIYIYDEAGLTVEDSLFLNNRAAYGGAVAFDEDIGALFDRTTFSENSASQNGGAIYFDEASSVDIRNSTLTGNSAEQTGGAIYFDESVLNVQFSTLVNNSAGMEGGGIHANLTGNPGVDIKNAAVQNSIIAGNIVNGNLNDSAADCSFADNTGFHSGGTNIFGATGGCATTRYDQAVAPADVFTTLLAPLANIGGPTLPNGSSLEAHAPLTGSQLINGANQTFCPDVDQIGSARPQGNGCDIGAVESGFSDVVASPADHTITVDTFTDGTGVPGCSLREAVEAANQDLAFEGCSAGNGWDTIALAAGTYPLSGGELLITSSITFQGVSSATTIIDANLSSRILNVDLAPLQVNDIQLINGKHSDEGGCIFIKNSSLILNDTAIMGCESTGDGAGVYIDFGTMLINNTFVSENVSSNENGGVYIYYGIATIQNSQVISNTSIDEGGGLYSYVAATRVSNSQILGNRSLNTNREGGGGVYHAIGSIIIEDDSIISNNESGAQGGGIFLNSGAYLIRDTTIAENIAGEEGGGIFVEAGASIVQNSSISNNQTILDGGGIFGQGYIFNSTIEQNSAISVSASYTNSGGGYYGSGIFVESIIQENQAEQGGGFYGSGAMLFNSQVLSNSAHLADGGGLYLTPIGSILLEESSVMGNQLLANKNGAGLYFDRGTLDLSGPGNANTIYQGTFVSHKSTIANNAGATAGGGVYGQNVTTLQNSTVSGNSADVGGGIWISGTLAAEFSTIAANSATTSGGGVVGQKIAVIRNSIVAGNTAPADADCSEANPFTYAGSSLFGLDTGCSTDGPTDQTVAPASVFTTVIDQLADNDGPTLTHALLIGSPAIDMGSMISYIPTDQRGIVRPQGNAPDIGAFEAACPDFPISVSNESGLNQAIDCYNQSLAGDYEINVTADITLTANTIPINNSTSGATLTINGNAFAIDGDDSYRPMQIDDSDVTLANITLQHGFADSCDIGIECGGAMVVNISGVVTLTQTSILNSQADVGGGGIFNQGTMVILESVISGNYDAGTGGGLYNAGSIIIKGSTLNGNSAYDAAGIFNDGGSTLTIINSTIYNNSASNNGGGIQNHGILEIINTTISENSASNVGGGISHGNDFVTNDSLTISNSIVADQMSGGDCTGEPIISSGYNLESGTSCGFTGTGDIQNGNANLGPLQDNGGPTETMALLFGSDAINAATANPDVPSDQRGTSRPQGTDPDIGAFEAICSGFPMSVGSEEGLNNAINCYNTAPAGAYEINVTADITLTANIASIDNNSSIALTINGNNHTIDGNNTVAIFSIEDSDVTISQLTMQNGLAANNACLGGGTRCGGAVYIDSSAVVTLTQTSVLSNTAKTLGGGVFNDGTVTIFDSTIAGNSANSHGGGLASQNATATVNRSTFSNNHSNSDGGGIYSGDSNASISNATFVGNTATKGGGIQNTIGTTTINYSTFSGNSANNGGAVHHFFGTTTIKNSIVANSLSGGDCVTGGGTFTVNATNLDSDGSCDSAVQSTTINLGPLQDNGGKTETIALLIGSSAIDAATADPNITTDQRGIARPQHGAPDIGAFELKCFGFPENVSTEAALNNAIECYNAAPAGDYEINVTADITLITNTTSIDNNTSGATLTINGADHTIDGNDSARPFNIQDSEVTISQLTIQQGVADSEGCFGVFQCGGGIFISDSAAVTLTRSAVLSSTASFQGGGIYSDGTLTINDSTLAGNSAASGGGLMSTFSLATVNRSTISNNSASSSGGGLAGSQSSLFINNSTIVGNSATNSGGGVNHVFGNTTINYSTISGNAASNGGGVHDGFGTSTIKNSIIANSAVGGTDCGSTDGTLHIDGTNLDSDGSCGDAVQKTTAEINLGPLQDNGGPSTSLGRATETMALLPGSAAIDAATEDADITIDQRDVTRPMGSAPDIGAYELVCIGFPINVATESDLNEAVGCYNGVSTTESYKINLTADIDLTGATTVISNTIAGVELTIDGQGFTIDGQTTTGGNSIFTNLSTGLVTIENITLTRGNETDVRGGGAIRNTGNMIVRNSTISSNSTSGDGGGIYNSGQLTVDRTTLTGNSGILGGAVFNHSGTTTIQNSTFSRNVGHRGGGFTNQSGTVYVINSTIFGNEAYGASGGGGVYHLLGGLTAFSNSIVAGNSATSNDVAHEINNGGAANSMTADSYNLFGDSGRTQAKAFTNFTPGASDIIATSDNSSPATHASTPISDTLDTALQNNGGDTATHALVDNSPAIDAGDNAVCAATSINGLDQRGGFRPTGAQCDIGAYEADGLIVEFTVSDAEVAEGNSGTVSLTFTITRSHNRGANSVTVNTADGTATAGDDYVALSNQLVSFTAGGDLIKTVTVSVNGDEIVEADETVTLTLSNPVKGTLSDAQGIGTMINDDSATLSIDTTDLSASEAGTTHPVTVTLSNPSSFTVTVGYQTADGSAMNGSDFTAVSGSLTFAPGEQIQVVEIPILDDTIFEGDETFTFTLLSPSGASLGNPSSVEVLIVDDEGSPKLSIVNVTVDEPSGDPEVMSFEVVLSHPAAGDVSLDFATQDSSATAGEDYVATSGNLIIAAGQTTGTIQVTVLSDDEQEGDESFSLLLSNVSGAELDSATSAGVTGTIRDEDTSFTIYLPIVNR